MTDLSYGGVDPSIIRELSGIYKPFVKAFKELTSNAFDADADLVTVRISDDFNSIELSDNGTGMTLFEFQRDFTRLGGSIKKNSQSSLTRKKRLRIGSKGIGFLAVARYCSAMEISSTTLRKHNGKLQFKSASKTIDLAKLLQVPISRNLLTDRFKITSLDEVQGARRQRLSASEFELLPNGWLRVSLSTRTQGHFELRYSLDCRDLIFDAVINYDYLLSCEKTTDLSQLSDFCSFELYPLKETDPRRSQQYTKIILRGLKEFVVRDLKTRKRPGRVRNIESESGLDQFVWHLERCTPIKYALPNWIRATFGGENLESPRIKSIDRLSLCAPGFERSDLRRSVWPGPNHEYKKDETVTVEVDIRRNGLEARGYVLGHRQPIFPAEYRGIAIRVRNVQVGPPTFFGLEQTLTGPSRFMLSQITGEINVLAGLDATDALNPGRDSFYEENPHYKLLKEELSGNGEVVTGLLGDIIKTMLERQQVVLSVEATLARATHYRNALLNLSMAINYYGSELPNVRTFFTSSSRSNGLTHRPNYDNTPAPRIAGLRVVPKHDIIEDHLLDFSSKTIYLNLAHDRWSNRIYLLGQHYDIIPKAGDNNDALCEIDTTSNTVYVNWGHTLRQQMGDTAFLKSAVAWKLSYLSCAGNIEAMMELALKLLTYNGA